MWCLLKFDISVICVVTKHSCCDFIHIMYNIGDVVYGNLTLVLYVCFPHSRVKVYWKKAIFCHNEGLVDDDRLRFFLDVIS